MPFIMYAHISQLSLKKSVILEQSLKLYPVHSVSGKQNSEYEIFISFLLCSVHLFIRQINIWINICNIDFAWYGYLVSYGYFCIIPKQMSTGKDYIWNQYLFLICLSFCPFFPTLFPSSLSLLLLLCWSPRTTILLYYSRYFQIFAILNAM